MQTSKGLDQQHKILCLSLASAAGVMVTISVFDLWLPLVYVDGFIFPSIALLSGGALFALISKLLSMTSLGHAAEPSHLLPLVASHTDHVVKTQQRNMRLALLTFVALTLHNFPEGLAVSVSSRKSEDLGITVAFAVAVHNFPEGMAIAAPLYAATSSAWKAILAVCDLNMNPDTSTHLC